MNLMKQAAAFNRYFTSSNGIDVGERVSVPRDEWRKLFAILESLAYADEGVPVVAELRSALNLMLTFFGMDEDDNNREVFSTARKAFENSNPQKPLMSNTEHEIGILESLDAAKELPDAKRDRFLIRHNDDGEFGQATGWLYRDGGDPCVVSGAPVWVWRPLKDLLATTRHTIVRTDHLAALSAQSTAADEMAVALKELVNEVGFGRIIHHTTASEKAMAALAAHEAKHGGKG